MFCNRCNKEIIVKMHCGNLKISLGENILWPNFIKKKIGRHVNSVGAVSNDVVVETTETSEVDTEDTFFFLASF